MTDDAAEFEGLAREIVRYQEEFERSGDGRRHRAFHVKLHAGVRAHFDVLGDIPEAARHGVFAEPRRLEAWVRLSNCFSNERPDWFPDLLGMSVKLLGVKGPKLLPGATEASTQDFLALNQPSIPVSDAAQLMLVSTACANFFTAPFKIIPVLGLAHTLKVVGWGLAWSWRHLSLRSLATEAYHSITPISLGPHPVKFSWRPRQGAAPLPPDASWNNFLREDIRARLAGGDVAFDFAVQFHLDDERTPIEGCEAWDPCLAPPVTIGRLTIPSADLTTRESLWDEHLVDDLSYNPWHALEAHRPLGEIQEARSVIYRASSGHWGHAAEPGGG